MKLRSWYRNSCVGSEKERRRRIAKHGRRRASALEYQINDFQRHGNLAVNSTYSHEKSFGTDKAVARAAKGNPRSPMVAHYLKHEAKPVIMIANDHGG